VRRAANAARSSLSFGGCGGVLCCSRVAKDASNWSRWASGVRGAQVVREEAAMSGERTAPGTWMSASCEPSATAAMEEVPGP
jgi:hypothetical protein